MKLFVCFLVLSITSSADTARILGIVPAPSYSHQVFFQPIWKELSLRGHQVTVLTTNPINDPTLTNLTEIDISSLYVHLTKFKFATFANTNLISFARVNLEVIQSLTEPLLAHPNVEPLIQNKSESFDLLMIEAMFPALYIFSERFNCPFIGVTTLESPFRNYAALGNPNHAVLYPEFMLHSTNLSFWERLMNVIIFAFTSIVQDYMLFTEQQVVVDKYFGNHYPRLHDIERKMSMMFTNTDLVLNPRRPLLPNVVRIGGGLHVKPPKQLPKELKEILDGATQGAIYFSLGSNVKSKDLSPEIQEVMLQTFAELPYLVLWKFEIDGRETPKNVITSKWFPQQDIFGHPNIRLFISQGGLQSTEEAIHNYIPIIAIPFMGDQPRNARIIAEKGIGISLELDTLNKESFKSTILEVIENPSYRLQAERYGKLAKDEPMTGLEKVIWWTEYVIRHKGASHLRRNEIPFYQYYLIDVIGFCLAVVSLIVYVVVKFVKIFYKITKYFLVKPKVKTQ